MSKLRADVFVAPSIPWYKPDGREGGPWSPISCTLIHGDSEAVLVDTPITISQTEELANWIKNTIPGKRLTKIYITHGHGDHFFGVPTLQRRFPGVEAIATPGTIAHLKQQIEPSSYKNSWAVQFPGQIDESFILPKPTSNQFYLEGHVLEAIEVGQADTHDSTVLWVPDLKLAVCGDVVYGDVHQMLGEANTKEKRDGWISSIRKIEELKPELVVPGHKRASEMDGAFHLEATRKYIETFEKLFEDKARNARELSQAMMEIYPTRFNPGALIVGCINAFKARSQKL
jgi:glyoxylase-like metal-dependent hydrolase (beta-lactamase superfamily II)